MECDMKELVFNGVRLPRLERLYGLMHRVVDDRWVCNGIWVGCNSIVDVDILSGFVFDGCSVPRSLWWIAGNPFEVPRVIAALVHDWLYTAKVCERKTADLIYRGVCRKVGLSAFRSWFEYLVLRLFGWIAWEAVSDVDEAEARKHGTLMIVK